MDLQAVSSVSISTYQSLLNSYCIPSQVGSGPDQVPSARHSRNPSPGMRSQPTLQVQIASDWQVVTGCLTLPFSGILAFMQSTTVQKKQESDISQPSITWTQNTNFYVLSHVGSFAGTHSPSASQVRVPSPVRLQPSSQPQFACEVNSVLETLTWPLVGLPSSPQSMAV